MKRAIMTSAVAALMATSAIAAGTLSEIEVEADLTAVGNTEAAGVWSGLTADLEQKIAERLATQIGEDGASVVVDIDEISLANLFEQTTGMAESKLVGDVEIDAPGLFNKMDYTLTVTSEQAIAYYPSGTMPGDVSVSSDVYYNAMLDAFADNIASKFDQ